MSPSPGYLVTDYHDDAGGPDQRRTASKYIDTPPRVTGDKLVRAASDASDEAAIESCYDQTVWAATGLIVSCITLTFVTGTRVMSHWLPLTTESVTKPALSEKLRSE